MANADTKDHECDATCTCSNKFMPSVCSTPMRNDYFLFGSHFGPIKNFDQFDWTATSVVYDLVVFAIMMETRAFATIFQRFVKVRIQPETKCLLIILL